MSSSARGNGRVVDGTWLVREFPTELPVWDGSSEFLHTLDTTCLWMKRMIFDGAVIVQRDPSWVVHATQSPLHGGCFPGRCVIAGGRVRWPVELPPNRRRRASRIARGEESEIVSRGPSPRSRLVWCGPAPARACRHRARASAPERAASSSQRPRDDECQSEDENRNVSDTGEGGQARSKRDVVRGGGSLRRACSARRPHHSGG